MSGQMDLGSAEDWRKLKPGDQVTVITDDGVSQWIVSTITPAATEPAAEDMTVTFHLATPGTHQHQWVSTPELGDVTVLQLCTVVGCEERRRVTW